MTATEHSVKKERDSNLELYRIFLMLAIIAHHYVVNSGLVDCIASSIEFPGILSSPAAASAARNILCLPMFAELTEEQQNKVTMLITHA